MSSAMNHKKRSGYSYHMRGAAFRAQSRKAYYRDGVKKANRGLFRMLAQKALSLFHRKSPKQPEHTGDQGAEE